MKKVLMIVGMICSVIAYSQEKTKHSFYESYQVSSSPELRIHNEDGAITIKTHNKDVIEVYYRVMSKNKLLNTTKTELPNIIPSANFKSDVNHTNESLDIKLKFKTNTDKNNSSFYIDLFILTPEKTTAKIYTGDGDLSFTGLKSETLYSETEDGDINLFKINASDLKIETGDGDVNLKKLRSKNINCKTGDGDVSLLDLDADLIQIKSGDGDIYMKNIDSDVNAKTKDGDIYIINLNGKLNTKTGDGEVIRK